MIKGQCPKKTGEKEMLRRRRKADKEEMLGCRMAMSSKGVMQGLQMSVDRQLLAEMVARAVGLTMLAVDGDVWAGRRHDAAD